MKWFTSDTHFGHINIINYCRRPFLDIDEMHREMIGNINAVVHPTRDELFHLGDFARGGMEAWDIRNDIKCQRIHLIMGNHDNHREDGTASERLISCGIFASIRDIATITLEGESGEGTKVRTVLCHYPLQAWQGKNRGYFHLHGHTHGLIDSPDEWRMDVGVDGQNNKKGFRAIGEYRPYSEEEIITIMIKKGLI